MAQRAAERIGALKLSGDYTYSAWVATNGPLGRWETNQVTMAQIQARQTAHLWQFAGTAARLQNLAEKESAQECFTTDDETFVNGLMEAPQSLSLGCAGLPVYDGWYPQSFYRAIYWTVDLDFHTTYGVEAFDSIITDVHTDPPADVVGDPGSVLHEAAGKVNLLMMAVDNGTDHFICAGPVLSHYELEVLGAPRRITDDEWKSYATKGIFLPASDLTTSRLEGLRRPIWTQEYTPGW